MSTRGFILVTGPNRRERYGKHDFCEYSTARLYLRSDAYPSFALDLINRALASLMALDRDGWGDKGYSSGALEALLIGSGACSTGGLVRLEEAWDEPFDPAAHLGDQCDLEWFYVIDTEEQTVKVYQSRFDQIPLTGFNRGPIDPTAEVDQRNPDARPACLKRIEANVQSIQAWSFKVNPKPAVSNVVRLPTVGQLLASMVKEPTAPKAKARKGSRLQPWQLKGGK